SCSSSCLILMIWSSRARNRSADPVVSCFFGRIALSNAATESCFSIRGNRENEIASFQGLRHGNLAISSQQSRQKKTLAQWVRNSSRATNYYLPKTDEVIPADMAAPSPDERFHQCIYFPMANEFDPWGGPVFEDKPKTRCFFAPMNSS